MMARSNLSFIAVVALGDNALVSLSLLIPISWAAIVLDGKVVLPRVRGLAPA